MSPQQEIRPLSALRGLAALWVMLHHLNGMAPQLLLPAVAANGWTAVDIFFVLSGYVLTAAYGTRARSELSRFYAKRICRIYPLHICIMLALAAVVLAAPFIGLRLRSDRFHDWSDFPVILALLQPYFPQHGQWWNAPSWSAAVELPCYAAFPFCVPFLAKLGMPARLTLMTVATIVQIWLQAGSTEGVFVGLSSFIRGASGFVVGVLLHELIAKWKPRRWEASLVEGAALSAIALACASGMAPLVQGAGALLIAALSRDMGIIACLLRGGPFVWLGRVSFSIYLLHEPVIALLLKLIPPGGAAEAMLTPLLHRILIIAAVMAASGATYAWIELPGQRLPARLMGRTRATAITAAAKSDGNCYARPSDGRVSFHSRNQETNLGTPTDSGVLGAKPVSAEIADISAKVSSTSARGRLA
jgi:peptidoglycan/LPS O-acetylase OafA/YrhL